MPDRKERVKLVRPWTDGVGADVTCDLVGFPAVIPEGIEMLRSSGTYLGVGTISRGATFDSEPSLLVWGSKEIMGVIQYDPWVIPRTLDFLVRTKSRWPWDPILSHTYPLEKINEAFAASAWHNKETRSITRAALTPEPARTRPEPGRRWARLPVRRLKGDRGRSEPGPLLFGSFVSLRFCASTSNFQMAETCHTQ